MGEKSIGKLMEEKIKNLNQVPFSEDAELAVLDQCYHLRRQ